ncbi:MAG: cupredoxin domain-containing protein [Nitrosarchaeum sp.]
MNKKQVNIISSIFLTIGIISAFLIFYSYLNYHIKTLVIPIDKNKALDIALQHGKWNQDLLEDKKIDEKLLHIKNDGFTFVVDENTLEDDSLYMTKMNNLKDQYVWLIQISLVGGSNREWRYLINATNGTVLEPSQNEVFEPIDPELIKHSDMVRQAKGNVTIIFPLGVSTNSTKYSPFPARLLVSQNDTVTWRNSDKQVHTVTSGNLQEPNLIGRVFDSGIIGSGESFSYTFSHKFGDTYQYLCLIHPWMEGSVIVQ